MTVGDLRKRVAAYLQVQTEDLTRTVSTGPDVTVDMLMVAANNAKKAVQNQFDWHTEKALCYTTTDANGAGSWDTMSLASDDSSVNVKQPITFYVEAESNVLVPLYHHTRKHGDTWARERLDALRYVADRRYLRDDEFLIHQYSISRTYAENYQIYLLGNSFEMSPQPTTAKTIYCSAHLWFDDYTDDADTDWFLDKGQEYMQWACVVELNHIFQTYVPRSEGSLSPPTKARDEALSKLVEYNNFQVESGRHPKR